MPAIILRLLPELSYPDLAGLQAGKSQVTKLSQDTSGGIWLPAGLAWAGQGGRGGGGGKYYHCACYHNNYCAQSLCRTARLLQMQTASFLPFSRLWAAGVLQSTGMNLVVYLLVMLTGGQVRSWQFFSFLFFQGLYYTIYYYEWCFWQIEESTWVGTKSWMDIYILLHLFLENGGNKIIDSIEWKKRIK